MTQQILDEGFLALCLWREARGEGRDGMVAVGSVIRNRVHRDRSTYYDEVTRRLQFSSLTAPGDPELTVYPTLSDESWKLASEVAGGILAGSLADPTGGATLYYAVTIGFPATWDRSRCRFTKQIGRHRFFREVSCQGQS